MATKIYSFPTYSVAAGDIHFSFAHPHDTAITILLQDDNVEIVKMTPLNRPFEIDPSSNKMRAGNMKISIGDLNNRLKEVGELTSASGSSVFNKVETIVTMSLNGNVHWIGRINHFKTTKGKDQVFVNGSLLYRKITFFLEDKFMALATMSGFDVFGTDLTGSEGPRLKDAHASFSFAAGIVNSEANLVYGYSEDNTHTYMVDSGSKTAGTASTQIRDEFRIHAIYTGSNALTVMKRYHQHFASLPFIDGDILRMIPLVNRPTGSLDTDDIISISEGSPSRNFRQVFIQKKEIVTGVEFNTPFDPRAYLYTHKHILGESNVNDKEIYKLDLSPSQDLTEEIDREGKYHVVNNFEATFSTYPNPSENPVTAGENFLTTTGSHLHTIAPSDSPFVEEGMMFTINAATIRIVANVPDANTWFFYPSQSAEASASDPGLSETFLTSDTFQFDRFFTTGFDRNLEMLIKTGRIIQRVAETYEQLFLSGNEKKLKIIGIWNPTASLVIDGRVHVPLRNIKQDFIKNQTEMIIRDVGDSSASWGDADQDLFTFPLYDSASLGREC